MAVCIPSSCEPYFNNPRNEYLTLLQPLLALSAYNLYVIHLPCFYSLPSPFSLPSLLFLLFILFLLFLLSSFHLLASSLLNYSILFHLCLKQCSSPKCCSSHSGAHPSLHHPPLLHWWQPSTNPLRSYSLFYSHYLPKVPLLSSLLPSLSSLTSFLLFLIFTHLKSKRATLQERRHDLHLQKHSEVTHLTSNSITRMIPWLF